LWPELRIGQLFPDARGYLDSATIGLPPANAVTAMLDAIDDWRSGRASAPGYDHHVARARSAFARIVGVPDEEVATGSQTSAFAGVVAASLARGAEVLCVQGDFTSVLFPFLVQRERGVTVRSVPLESIADEVRDSTDLVALSAVQSADGRIADLDAVAQAARRHDSATFIDVTQACGWFPLDASQYDYVACSAYKWLLSPRGSAFFAVRPERLRGLIPHGAGWYAGQDPWASIYGEPLRLARDARRLDLSPAWLCWVGTAPALELLADMGPEAVGAHSAALARRLREALGLAPSRSAIVSLDARGARERLERAGIRASVRGGAVRLSLHLYNDEADVDAVIAALRPDSLGE
jgi:selenocysteine lyase/cysteine desulfurase